MKYTLLYLILFPFIGYSQLSITATAEDATCNSNGTIEAVAADGNASNYQYSLIEPSQETRPAQSSGTFTSLPAGSYTVQVADGVEIATTTVEIMDAYTETEISDVLVIEPTCEGGSDGSAEVVYTGGSATPLTFQLINNVTGAVAYEQTDNPLFNNIVEGEYTAKITDNCGSERTFIFSVDTQNEDLTLTVDSPQRDCDTSTGRALVSGVRPITVVVKNAAGDVIDTKTISGNSSTATLTYPNEDGITVQASDACGNESSVVNIDAATYSYTQSVLTEDCGYTLILNDILVSDETMNEKEFCYRLVGETEWTCQSSSTFTGLPAGDYETKIEDTRCGTTYTNTISIVGLNKSAQIRLLRYTCLDATTGIEIRANNYDASTIVTYVGGSLPDFTKTEDNGGGLVSPTLQTGDTFEPDPNSAGRITFPITNFPPGTYDFTIEDQCSDAPVPISITITENDIIDYELVAEVTPGCPGDNSIEFGFDAAPRSYSENGVPNLLRLEDAGGATLFNTTTLVSGNRYTVDNLDAGTYTLSFSTTSTADSAYPDCPQSMTQEIVIPEYALPDLTNSSAYTCDSDQSILADATGVEPITFEIAPVGSSTFQDPNTDGVFTGYDSSTSYKIKATDACGNSTVYQVGTPGDLQDPIIDITYDCVDDTGSASSAILNVTPIYGAVYSWTDQSGATLSTETSLTTPISEGDVYTVTVSIPGSSSSCQEASSTKSITTVDCSAILPIELQDFWGLLRGESIVLNWTTTSEKNNAYFEIQRSQDAIQWKSIGTIKGKGDSEAKRDYKYEDKSPLIGHNYYRLKTVSIDNDIEYSDKIVVISIQDRSSSFIISPNPVVGEGTAKISFPSSMPVDAIVVFDVYGRRIDQRIVEDQFVSIVTKDYHSGIFYILAFKNKNLISSQKFTVGR